MTIDQLMVQSYLLGETHRGNMAVTLERCPQRDGRILWAVRWMGRTMDHDGEWEFEPIPSSRDDDYIRRCRFEFAEAALETWERSKGVLASCR